MNFQEKKIVVKCVFILYKKPQPQTVIKFLNKL